MVIHDLRPMNSRIQFLIKNSVCQQPCSCSGIEAWSYYPHNQTHAVGKNNDRGYAAKKRKLKRKQNATNDNNRKKIAPGVPPSSFIGFNKIVSSKTTFGKIVWSLLTLGCLIGFLYQALKFAFVYQSLPTEVVLRVENNGTVEFPAVTVCNNNRIRKSEYCKYYPYVCKLNKNLTISESTIFNAYFEALNHVPEYKSDLGYSLDIVKGCNFKGVVDLNYTECLKRFVLHFDPDYGNCFTFLSKDHESERYLVAKESDFWQRSNALSLLLDVEEEEYTEKARHKGFSITVHSNEFLPDVHTDSIEVEPRSFYSLAVQQSITKLLPYPFSTNCTSFEELPWINEHFLPSSRMCTVHCSRHFQLINCNYVTRNLSLFYDKFPWDTSTITEAQKKCAADIEEKTKSFCRSLCGVPCEDIQFEVAVGKTTLEITDLMEFNDNEADLDPKWKEFVAVRIFYKTIEKKLYEHSAMYDDLELFSYLGGYSGVWLGFSLLNLFELLEILLVFIHGAIVSCRKNGKENQENVRLVNRIDTVQEPCYGNPFPKPLKVKKSKKKRCC